LTTSEERHGSATIGERRTSVRHRVEGSHCTYRSLEESGERPLSGQPVEPRRRWSRRLGWPRGWTASRLRLPDRIVSPLAAATEQDRLRPWAVRRELHDRRTAR